MAKDEFEMEIDVPGATPIIPTNPQVLTKKDMTPSKFDDAEVGAAVAPTPYQAVNPGESRTNFMKRTQGTQRPNFDGDDASKSLYFNEQARLKQGISKGLASADGSVRNDPDALFNQIVRDADVKSPNYIPFVRDTYEQQLRKSPIAQALVDQEAEDERQKVERGFPEAVEQVRSTLSPAGRELLDQGRDNELLQRLFPAQYGETGQPAEGTEAARSPILTNEERAQGGKRREITPEEAFKSQYRNIVAGKVASGEMTDEQALRALDVLDQERTIGSVEGLTTTTKQGRLLAQMIGMPTEKETRTRSGVQTENVALQDVVDTAQQQTAQAGTKRRLDQQKEDRRTPPVDGEPALITVTGEDGQSIQMIKHPDGHLTNAPGKKAEKLAPGAYNTSSPDILFVGQDGKSKSFPKDANWLGSDGKIRAKKPRWDAGGKFLGYDEPKLPPGVTNITDEPATNQSQEDYVSSLMKANEGLTRERAIRYINSQGQ